MDEEHRDQPPEEEGAEAHRRLLLPLLIPAAAFLFAVLVIYGLSRIYLDLQSFKVGDVSMATPLALAVALGILGAAWYLATHPRVPGWQIGSMVVVAAALLTGGAIWAAVHEEEIEAGPSVEDGGKPTPTGELVVTMGDNFFEFQGQEEPTIEIPAGQGVTLDLVNNGVAVHNMHVDGSDGTYQVTFCEPGGEEACSDPKQMQGGESGTIALQFEQTGTFLFRCDFHPTEMTGTIEVVEGGEALPPDEEPDATPPEPGASPGPTEPEGAAAGEIVMGDNFFEVDGEREPAIEVPLGQEVTFDLVNEGVAIHNMHVAGTDNDYGTGLCQAGGEEPCSDPDQMSGGETGTITFQLDEAGTFDFRCDFHPTDMFGTIEVQ